MTPHPNGHHSPKTLVDSLRHRADGPADGRGYCFLADGEADEAPLDYRTLDLRARAIGGALGRLARPGDRAIILVPPGLEFLPALFGCLYGGGIAVPVSVPRPNRPSPQLQAIAADSGASVVLTTSRLLAQREAFTKATPALAGLRWAAVDEFDESEAAGWTPPRLGGDDLAILQYTSGTTGQPKGVMLPHRALLHNLEGMRARLGLDETATGVCWLPPFHDMGLIGNLFQGVYSGAHIVFMAPATFVQRPLRWLAAISRHRAYVSGGPNFAFELCARTLSPDDCSGLDLSTWRVAYVGSEPVSAETLDRFARAFAPFGFAREAFYPCYGLAESSLMVTGGAIEATPIVRHLDRRALEQRQVQEASAADPDAKPLVGCGRAVPGLEVRIVDPETSRACDAGRVGEIWVAGPSVGLGYWGRPELSEQTFRASVPGEPDRAYLRTGDLGCLHEGELFVTGRIKDLIIIRGRNYYPQDLEATLVGCHPCLREGAAAVFAAEGEEGTPLVAAAELERHHRPEDREDAVRAIRRAIAEVYELDVSAVVLVKWGGLPRTSSGKSRRRECLRRFLAGELEVVHQWKAAGAALERPAPEPRVAAPAPEKSAAEIRRWLAARIGRQVGLAEDQVDPAQPFQAFGLDSVTLVGLSAELETWLGRPLSPTLFYDAPTIEVLARHLSPEGDAGPAGNLAQCSTAAGREPIAIVGLSCRFPGAETPEGFWRMLREGRDAVRELPEGRWAGAVPEGTATLRGGFLDRVDEFDPQFFGIAPREAVFIDPQHRLLLEGAWEALENAGVAPDRLAGRKVGVFVGISTSDYGRMLARGPGLTDAYFGTGNALSLAPNRVSYHLDLRGPSLAVDTACSSSLTAVHLACRSLREGESEMAIVGGVNLILTPDLTLALSRAQMLSPGGRCRTFDASADGYVRGEGCGVVVLMPLSAAVRGRHTIRALIRGSATNQDGRSNGITAPNALSQIALIRDALRDAEVAPVEVSYVEAHGTGTALGDPIEFEALKAVLGPGERPCDIGAVKTNVGHLESAAGIAGLIKAVLQLENVTVVPTLHFSQLNPHIHPEGSRLRIAEQSRAWGRGPSRRIAGVSAFGFGGANAHVVLEEAPAGPAPAADSDRPCHLFTLSARTEDQLRELARRFADDLDANPGLRAGDVGYTTLAGRARFEHRLAVRAGDLRELGGRLRAYVSGERTEGVHAGQCRHNVPPRLAFLFTGQGSQYAGMGAALLASSPPFRTSIERMERAFRAQVGASLIDLLSSNGAGLASTELAQPALYSLGFALAELWRGWGVEPAAVMGHSLGEYTAAAVAARFSFEDGLKLVAERGRLMERSCPPGAMAAVFAPFDAVSARVAEEGERLAIAAINGPSNVVISGTAEAVRSACESLQDEGYFSQPLPVTRAYHSALIAPALDGLARAADALPTASPRIPIVSNLTGELAGPSDLTGDYWRRHAREPVRFLDGLRRLRAEGFDTFLEVGPTATLCGLGKVSVNEPGVCWLPTLKKGHDDWAVLVDSLAALAARGVPIDGEAFEAPYPRRRVALPTYPFERTRYWVEMGPPTADEVRHAGHESPATMPGQPAAPPERRGLPTPRQLAEVVGPASRALAAEALAQVGEGLRDASDRAAADSIREALVALGWTPRRWERFTPATLAGQLGVVARHRRLFGRLLEILAEDGWLRPSGDTWEVARELGPIVGQAGVGTLAASYPACAGELELAETCARSLPDVLRGKLDPLLLLFPGGSTQRLEDLYERSPFSRVSNRIAAQAVARAIEHLPRDRPVRILEVGAGTGGTTAHVLPAVPRDGSEYVFTDISPLFTQRASARFGDHPALRTATLDIEAEPWPQPFDGRRFDVVLAANVLHATRDLRRSLRNVRRLLAPDGLLVLVEGTRPSRLLDLIFGLTEGWWRFSDDELRPDYPLISGSRWAELLQAEGFEEPVCLPSGAGADDESGQAVILARGPSRVEEPTVVRPGAAPPLEGRATPPSADLRHQGAPQEVRPLALRDVRPERRQAILLGFLRGELGRLLGLPASSIDADRPVTSFGLDSLMAIQLKNRVEAETGVSLSIVTMLEGLPAAQIAEKILVEMFATEPRAEGPIVHRNGKSRRNGHVDLLEETSGAGRSVAEAVADDLEHLSETELDGLIDDLFIAEDDLDDLGADGSP